MKHLGIVKHRNHTEKHDSKLRKFVDEGIYFFAILGPAMTLPQVYDSLILGKVEGISIITWVGWAIIAVFWVIYGIVHKDKPIILSNLGWISVYLLVIIAVFIYG